MVGGTHIMVEGATHNGGRGTHNGGRGTHNGGSDTHHSCMPLHLHGDICMSIYMCIHTQTAHWLNIQHTHS